MVANAHTLAQVPVIVTADPPQGGYRCTLGYSKGTETLEYHRERVLRVCFRGGISSKVSSLVMLAMDSTTYQGFP